MIFSFFSFLTHILVNDQNCLSRCLSHVAVSPFETFTDSVRRPNYYIDNKRLGFCFQFTIRLQKKMFRGRNHANRALVSVFTYIQIWKLRKNAYPTDYDVEHLGIFRPKPLLGTER